jgi:hypothetical protein
MEPAVGAPDDDATRIALSMVRADWQRDSAAWHELYAVADDPEAVTRELTHLCRQTLDQLAGVAGVSTGEMLHRLAGKLIPHPQTGHVTIVDLRGHHLAGSAIHDESAIDQTIDARITG